MPDCPRFLLLPRWKARLFEEQRERETIELGRAFTRLIIFTSSESSSSSSVANYDTGFTRENIRLEKDVLSKLGVG